ncbi:MAG: methyltransferase domain-containing protein [Polyangiaceae bacterium]
MSARIVGARDFFGKIAAKYDRSYALERDESRARMKRIVQLLPAKSRVLDLGVGTGRELPFLLDAGHEVIGVDVAPEMIALCAKRSRPIALHLIDFWTTRLPFPDAHFGAVIALHGTLAHPPEDADAALRILSDELARVTSPGAVVLFETPSPEFLTKLAHDQSPVAQSVGADRSLHEDEALEIAIEARAISPDRWNAAFSKRFDVRFEPVSPVEQLVVGVRIG